MDNAQKSAVRHKSRRKSSSPVRRQKKRPASEGGKHESPTHNVSRRSSTGSSVMSLDVRCACQYFQSDSLLPERQNYIGVHPVSHTSISNIHIRDHEYEPVNPPDEEMKPPDLSDDKTNLNVNHNEEQLKHITFSDDIRSDTTLENFIETPSAQNFQDEMEGSVFKPSKVTLNKTDDLHIEDQTPSIKSENKTKDKPAEKRSTGNNFNEAIRIQADKIKTKLQNIKKPHINLPQPPKFSTATFSKLKFKKPTITVPKLPEMPSIKFASLSLPRKNNSKNSWRKRQYSTESNAGDSKTKKFDFGTYPRIFDKSKKTKKKSIDDSFEQATPPPTFATVPRVSRSKASRERKSERVEKEKDDEPTEYYYDKPRGFVTIPIDVEGDNPLHIPSHIQYNQNIDIDDGFNEDTDDPELPNVPINITTPTKWNGESLNKTNLNINGEASELQSDQSSASLNEHRQGVLEEIDSDQFFLREKGISQDDIDVGKYLSSEIKEAFKNPINALTQLQSDDREYDVDDQSQSSDETPKRKWIKKPKRKKTPHVSNEQLSFELGSDHEDNFVKHTPTPPAPTPTRPKRRSKKSKKKKSQAEDIVPYQETIPFEVPFIEPFDFIDNNELVVCEPTEYIGSSGMYQNEFDIKDDESTTELPMYMNTQAEEIEAFPMYINTWQNIEFALNLPPIPPARKNKSVKSLNAIENDANTDRNVSVERSNNSFEVSRAAEEEEIHCIPPSRPNRRRSHTRSESVSSLREHGQAVFDTPPIRPIRFRSRTRSDSFPFMQDNEITASATLPIRPKRIRPSRRSQSTESLPGSRDLGSIMNTSVEIFCVEEPCVQIMCDHMGYAIVDKTKIRDPPLPPSRFPLTPPRTRRKKQSANNDKFAATVPRRPERPLRNYSTLSKPILISTSSGDIFDDDKENVDVNPYIEIDEAEIARRLQSGEVIQKMRERPLPAPPRPPRKARTPNREIFRDISHERNLPYNNDTLNSKYSDRTDFPSELTDAQLLEMEQQILTDDHEETVTHAALIVQPLAKSNMVSHSEFFNSRGDSNTPPLNERVILIEQENILTNPDEHLENFLSSDPMLANEIAEEQQFVKSSENVPSVNMQQLMQEQEESDDEELSEIPQEFYNLKKPDSDVHKLQENDKQVADFKVLDIDKFRVDECPDNEVPDLEEEVSMEVSEINSTAGNLVSNEIELLQNTIQERIDLDQEHSDSSMHNEKDIKLEELEDHNFLIASDESEPPPVPPRSDSIGNLVDATMLDGTKYKQKEIVDCSDETIPPLFINNVELCSEILPELQIIESENVINHPPVRPPRKSSQTEKHMKDVQFINTQQLLGSNFNKMEDIETESNEDNFLQNNLISEARNITQQNIFLDSTTPSESLAEINYRGLPSFSNVSQISQSQPNRETYYVESQTPLNFYNLRPSLPDEFDGNNIPLVQCRQCRRKFPTLSRSSSLEELSPKQQRPRQLSEPSIPQLTGQLVQSCAVELDRSLRDLITYLTNNFLCSADSKQDLKVLLLMLVVLIASLILMSSDGKIEHIHHWEYFNPPREF